MKLLKAEINKLLFKKFDGARKINYSEYCVCIT